ncbi:MAG: amidase [Bryobacterales bacterium]|nr:amidase [Bryobacterales bacterium]
MPRFPGVTDCLRAIKERDPEIHAWVSIAPQPRSGDGPLNDIPFGIKDIFDVAGFPTRNGSPVYDHAPAAAKDSGLAGLLRQKGAVIVGKTHTAAFAYFDHAPTRNPHNREHTPGGSSSGSAAAVGSGMIPFATGSQTQGSIVRPASFCGCVGFKPTHGLLPLTGCLEFAATLDTAGFFSRNVGDMTWLWRSIGYANSGHWERARVAAFPAEAAVEPTMRKAYDAAVAKLGVKTIQPPPTFPQLFPAVKLIQDTEGGRTLKPVYEKFGKKVGAKLAEMIERGLANSEFDYQAALRVVEDGRRDMAQLFNQWDVILTPSAVGPAPEGFATTGDPRMNAPWTGLGTPSAGIPMPVANGALPLGLQIASARGKDTELLAAALEIEAALAS